LEELRDFHQTYGHYRVPKRYLENLSLGHWVSNMRKEFRKRKDGKQSSITVERIAALNNLGFDWVVINEAWEIRLEELRDFRQTYGHCRVPKIHLENLTLGHWVSYMRKEFRKRKEGKQSSMTAERIAALNNLGFDWIVINEA